ncbi:hypothetical protein M501DRAFT_995934 [Patellaria atrata CBS 101060]|uniref:Uncharacterized protein n=1 Tax=Patellaria atrata CBS 101060 TaxID=1346257 RepID=A0A9P4S737_9PEZI|nr:hypothetical protein M501DRAFT_995934 [Patellaria atrata CBS 101060]
MALPLSRGHIAPQDDPEQGLPSIITPSRRSSGSINLQIRSDSEGKEPQEETTELAGTGSPGDNKVEKDDAESKQNVNPINERVDIIVLISNYGKRLREQTHITNLLDLDYFIEGITSSSQKADYLFLIEDPSPEVYFQIAEHISPGEFPKLEHTDGRVNNPITPQNECKLVEHSLSSTIFDTIREKGEHRSLTWWRLFSHRRDLYTHEKQALDEAHADTSKFVVPHFAVQISDTQKDVATDPVDLKDVKRSMNKMMARQWRKAQKKGPTNRDKSEEKEDVVKRSVYKLDCETYRPHQVITEVKDDDVWGTAAEERISFFKFEKANSAYSFILFDKPRSLRQYHQVFKLDIPTNSISDWADKVLNDIDLDDPSSQLVQEEKQSIISSTFLTRNMLKSPIRSSTFTSKKTSKVLSHKSNNLPERKNPWNSDPLPSFRQKFIQTLKNNWFWQTAQTPFNKYEINMMVAQMLADDWNLVLSQMVHTLNDIDGKMSDNAMLREHVLEWRRLLCSWRVSISDYNTRLTETQEWLQVQLDSEQINVFMYRLSLQPVQIAKLYSTLKENLEKIESRVDRSFQALMSSMSIIESEKAIGQGVNIGRLTELAFFFIPLNFACTFFSMQIKDFDGENQPSLGNFFALAVTLLVCLYLLRGFIRSRLLANVADRMDKTIREVSRVPGSSSIPTRVMISFIWQKTGIIPRAVLIVLPFFALTVSLIWAFCNHLHFRILSTIIMVIGSMIVLVFLALQSYIRALRSTVIVIWLMSIFAVALGPSHYLNPAVMATACILLTTTCAMALASIPQRVVDHPFKRAFAILLPLWLIVLPVAIVAHYYHIANPHWDSWKLAFAIQGIFYGFMSFVAVLELKFYGRWPQFLGISIATVGIPLTIVWAWSPVNGDHVPLYAQILVSLGTFILFTGALYIQKMTSKDFPTAVILFIALVGVPIDLVWTYFASGGWSGDPIPLWAQLCVTFGCIVLYCVIIIVVSKRKYILNADYAKLAWVVGWLTIVAWWPTMVWVTKTGTLGRAQESKDVMIHVTWSWILGWLIVLLVFWYVSQKRRQSEKRRRARP